MKKILALALTLAMLLSLCPAAFAVNEDVEGEIVIYSSMYQFVLDMLDEALKKEFPNPSPATKAASSSTAAPAPSSPRSTVRWRPAPLTAT